MDGWRVSESVARTASRPASDAMRVEPRIPAAAARRVQCQPLPVQRQHELVDA